MQILLSKLQVEGTQTREPQSLFSVLLSFGWLILNIRLMQMISLWALILPPSPSLPSFPLFGFEKYIFRDKEEGMFSSFPDALGRGLWAPEKHSC